MCEHPHRLPCTPRFIRLVRIRVHRTAQELQPPQPEQIAKISRSSGRSAAKTRHRRKPTKSAFQSIRWVEQALIPSSCEDTTPATPSVAYLHIEHLQLGKDGPLHRWKSDWCFPTIVWNIAVTKIEQSRGDIFVEECERLNAGADPWKLDCIRQ